MQEKAAIIIATMHNTLLGGLTPRQFLRRYWQKKPLLIRNAIPGFCGLLSRDELMALARRDDVESRLIDCIEWTLEHGPLRQRDFGNRKKPWTLLVQGINLLLDEGDQLLRQFDFVPYARMDDVMASYATNGGGVGPHVDNYDVFLLQGAGQRRWRISAQKDVSLRDGQPLKLLKNFRPTEEFVLHPGDMLYLPPQIAHEGVALGECTTWSIGFRAPPYGELGEAFLTHLQDNLRLDDRYCDADLRVQTHAAEISRDMIDRVAHELNRIDWDRSIVADFLGCYLTEPKHNVFFAPPAKPLSQARFQAAARRGVRLDRRSQLLFAGKQFYINGEKIVVPPSTHKTLKLMADRRKLDGVTTTDVSLFHQWYCDGYLHLR